MSLPPAQFMDEEASPGRRIGRRDNRIFAMQLLYAHEISPLTDFQTHWNGLRGALELPEESLAYGRLLAEGTVAHLFEINALLKKFLSNWTLDRVEKVSLAILRIAVYELLFLQSDVPPLVTINEAIELGKLYADPDSKRLINGVLDNIRRHLAEKAALAQTT
jgi:N utilization substance protein B